MSAPGPLVSVIMPAYNAADYIEQTLQSALAQSYAPIEIVVVDDGSTDNTAEVVARLGDRVRLVRQPNAGASAARNRAMRESRGDYLAFLDADDLWHPDKTARQIQALERHPDAVGAYCDYEVWDVTMDITYLGRAYDDPPGHTVDIAPRLFCDYIPGLNTSAIILRRQPAMDAGLMDETLTCCEDWDFFLRVAELGPYVYAAQQLATCRDVPGSLMERSAMVYETCCLRVLDGAMKRWPERYAPLQNKARALAYNQFGLTAYQAFRLRQARRHFLRSLRHQWSANVAGYWARAWLPTPLLRLLRGMRERQVNARRRRTGR